jgi:hypothetical protein
LSTFAPHAPYWPDIEGGNLLEQIVKAVAIALASFAAMAAWPDLASAVQICGRSFEGPKQLQELMGSDP